MKIARRMFLVAAGAFAASPVLAKLLPKALDVAPGMPASPKADQNDLVFKIDGWSAHDRVASSCDERWLTINKSCRAVWR
jgi:hypothetical protein